MPLIDHALEDSAGANPAILDEIQDDANLERAENSTCEINTDAFDTANQELTSVVESIKLNLERKEIYGELLKQGTISRAQAEMVSEHFKDFLTPKLSLEEFTQYPSRTNYAFTLGFMTRSLESDNTETKDKWAKCNSEIMNTLSVVGDAIENQLLPRIYEQCDASMRTWTNEYQKRVNDKNLIYMADKAGVDFRSAFLGQIDFRTLNSDRLDIPTLVKAKESLLEAYSVPGVHYLFDSNSSSIEPVNFISAPLLSNLTVPNLAYFLCSENTKLIIETQQSGFTNEFTKLQQLIEQCGTSYDKLEAMANEIYSTHSKLLKFYDFFIAVDHLFNIVPGFMQL